MAEHTGNTLLAQAFESEDAVLLNETVENGGYQITLSGLVSGAGLSQWTQDVEQSHTYAVVSVQRTDGEAITQENFDLSQHTLTPLVSGYSPLVVNSWTLEGGVTGFAQDGVYYYLLDTLDLNPFADHTVYLAFYEGKLHPLPGAVHHGGRTAPSPSGRILQGAPRPVHPAPGREPGRSGGRPGLY